MTDVYIISMEDGAPTETVFIGHPLTGGYSLRYCQQHEIFEVAPEKYTEDTINFITHSGCKAKEIDGRRCEYVESLIDLLNEEIEKLHKKSSSIGKIAERLNELLASLN